MELSYTINQYKEELKNKKAGKCKASELLDLYGRVYQCHLIAIQKATSKEYSELESILYDIEDYVKKIEK